MKKLYELYYTTVPGKEGAEDAVFIRKPLGGYSCASCEKDLTNLYQMINQRPEYANWNKFPVRESTERVPKASPPSNLYSRPLATPKY